MDPGILRDEDDIVLPELVPDSRPRSSEGNSGDDQRPDPVPGAALRLIGLRRRLRPALVGAQGITGFDV